MEVGHLRRRGPGRDGRGLAGRQLVFRCRPREEIRLTGMAPLVRQLPSWPSSAILPRYRGPQPAHRWVGPPSRRGRYRTRLLGASQTPHTVSRRMNAWGRARPANKHAAVIRQEPGHDPTLAGHWNRRDDRQRHLGKPTFSSTSAIFPFGQINHSPHYTEHSTCSPIGVRF